MPPEIGKPTSAAKSSPGKSSANLKALGGDDASKKSTSERAIEECAELEEELMVLKVTYEQYFMGNERLPPTLAHDTFRKRLNKLKTGLVRNTAVKFRISSLYNKFLTYERLWQRTLQEIESGTYKRDMYKAKRRANKSGDADKRKGEAHNLTEEISEDDLEEVLDIVPNEPKPVAEPQRFIPRPVEPGPAAVPFRPVPSVATVPAVGPMVPAVAPTVAPMATGGTPFRGTPSVAPLPSIPAMTSPAKGTGSPPGVQAKGAPTIPPGATPSKGTPAIPPVATPSKGTASVPPGGTPARGTSGSSSPPARGVPAFGAPSQGSSGIAAALESLADEPLGAKPSAPSASRPPPSAGARPGAPSSAGSKPGMPAAAKPASQPSQPPKPAAGGGGGAGLSDEKLKAVYDAYVTAKRRNQEDTSKMNYESVAANLRKQVPELLKQHNAKSVEFKVVIKDGKATLKAVPK
ncbi:MXAN_5187 C-terminal domain-containing protein [Hyalangium minutum]|uniref:Uncharacterized protein n=1 Tax=Hyalangium minutum TaxID=394096 RepID=A0A085WKC8_9BACT|nr:MXAN_5187 C-terminal domain-containing protein [Hyalangium minutum]KFE68141.1 hypothetical protein DB31_7378 [Hyalangium minutum]